MALLGRNRVYLRVFIIFLLFFYDLPLRSPVIWGKSGYQSNNYWALGTTPRAKLLSTTHIVSKKSRTETHFTRIFYINRNIYENL